HYGSPPTNPGSAADDEEGVTTSTSGFTGQRQKTDPDDANASLATSPLAGWASAAVETGSPHEVLPGVGVAVVDRQLVQPTRLNCFHQRPQPIWHPELIELLLMSWLQESGGNAPEKLRFVDAHLDRNRFGCEACNAFLRALEAIVPLAGQLERAFEE